MGKDGEPAGQSGGHGSDMEHRATGRLGRTLTRAALALSAMAGLLAGAWAGDGAWKERSQLIWDASAGKLTRQTLRAWDPHPELDLDFVWEADGGQTTEGAIAGSGRLLWLAKGAPAYDRQAIFSEYEGEVRDGRPDGEGRLRLKSGRLYEGTWRGGLMVGRGMLRFENGDRYLGEIDKGEPDGFGRYASLGGTVFEGRFRAGQRDGVGTLTMPDTRRFRSVWEGGVEISRTPIDESTVTIAQNSGIAVSAYIDTRMNNAFVDADPDMLSYAYTATPSAGEIDITLDAPQILDIWKGDAVLRNDAIDETAWLFEGPDQFAPVFLVVEISNETSRTAQVTSAWFDLAESVTDYQPYVTVRGSGSMMFDPTFYLRNFGWGAAFEARLVYAFGNESGPVTEDFFAEIGIIDQFLEATAIDGLIALGVDVDTLSAADLECPRAMIDDWQCPLEADDFAELLGGLGGAAFVVDNFLKTRMTGQLEYQWVDAGGNLNTRVSPISIDLPLIYPSAWAEGGAPGPIRRGFPTIPLPLDQRNVRIPIPFSTDLAPGESRRFALNFVAEKSSRHLFQFVFELADGSIASSPTVDLLYFTPRVQALN